MIILVGGQKGGCGKTTIATNIALMRTLEGRNVHLYDIDHQEMASLWASLRDQDINLPVISSSQGLQDGKVIKNDLTTLRSEYQDVVVDVGGGNNEALRAALLLADIVIFPIVPSGIDVWTFKVLNNLIAGARSCNKIFKARILLNRINTNPTRAKKIITKCDSFLSHFDNLTRLNSFLSQRAVVEDSSLEGLTIVEYKPADSKAIEEFKSIYKEVFSGH